MTETPNNRHMVWIDLEMTGLDPEAERIIEIATIVTDGDLNVLAEGPVYCVRQSDELLAGMDEWNTEHHTASGLVDRVRQEGIGEREAELGTLTFLRDWVSEGEAPLCGNSVGQDRRFLVRYMPDLERFLHYRNVDVSTVKELAFRWRPDIAKGVSKKNMHRALDDIKESIEELRYYRQHFFSVDE